MFSLKFVYLPHFCFHRDNAAFYFIIYWKHDSKHDILPKNMTRSHERVVKIKI